MVRLLVCCVVALAGCYEPKLPDCAVRCAADGDCAPGQSCREDGWCTAPGMTESCASTAIDGFGSLSAVDAATDGHSQPDATSPSDAPPTDAPPSVDASPGCAPGCPGRCENGVCIIECFGEKSCKDEVRCPNQGPCEVLCAGERSCENGVRCGLGRCTVTCSGEKSCEERVDCEDSCACDVYCTGDKACGEDSECPESWCEVGEGCRSWGACNGC